MIQRVTILTLMLVLAAACGRFPGIGVKPVSTDAPDLENPGDTSREALLPAGGPETPELPENADAATSQDPTAGVALANIAEIATNIGLTRLQQVGYRGQNQRIAILDNGFSGLKNSLESKRLAEGTIYVPGRPGTRSADTAHGTKLAEVVHALAPDAEILLINSNGYSNFIRAIDEAIVRKATMVLYAQVWEYGGNFDGGGFINHEVNRATAAGILWVNAAGNYGLATWEGTLQAIDGTTAFVSPAREYRYIRFHLPSASNAKMVLTWNDFHDEKDYRTKEDFDLVIEDAGHREVASGRLIQDGAEHGLQGNDEKYSAHAREIVRAQLPQGTYFARIDVKNSDNIARLAKLRFSVDAFGAQILDSRSSNSIMIPADNPQVVTVGAWDTAMSATGDGPLWNKPNVMAPSRLSFVDGQTVMGSSSAAAIAAGALAVWQSRFGRINHTQFQEMQPSGTFGDPATRHIFVQ